ncbi:MAG: hypothetical protein NTY66_02760 [Candidatus Vogelbacteria bacterium]|nr:hypothetical protein [Candidatus Vogelbacteria bacterium]
MRFFPLKIRALIFGLIVLVVILAAWSASAAGTFSSTTNEDQNISVEVDCPLNICLFRGCTDIRALNYDPLAGLDDGTCKFKENPIVITGCMDPEEDNYNPSATEAGPCTYTVPNVNNLVVIQSGLTGSRISWSRPGGYAHFSSVIVIRKAGSLPVGREDGETVYQGSGSSFTDSGLSYDMRYYYLVIVKSTANRYSSGAIENILIPKPGEPPPSVGPIGPSSGGGIGSLGYIIPSPFEDLPLGLISTSTKKKLDQIPELFVLKQPGERNKPFFDGSYVKIRGSKPFTVSVDYYKMPEVLKTIGMTLYNLSTRQSFSFLLKLNENKTAYEATIGALPEDGVYGTSIYLINYENQTIKKFEGQIAVVGALGILGVGTERLVRNVGPVAVTGGALAGLFQLLFAGGGSVSEIYILLLRQFGALLGYFGLKKKNKPWGTVYDSVTKRPIDPAYVSVLASGEEIATAITDIDGRYGFSLLDGEYSLSANKTHYRFPSSLLLGQVEDIMYGNLYFGGPFHVGAGEVISKNIPLDPLDFDWNEFVKAKGKFFDVFKKREMLRARITNYLFKIGAVASFVYLLFRPSLFNIFVIALYIAIYLIQRIHRIRHQVVIVRNAITGEPVPFAVVRAFFAGGEQEVKKVVTDMVGRFYLLLRPGTYYLTIDHKQPDGSYARIHQTASVELKKGVWDQDIFV